MIFSPILDLFRGQAVTIPPMDGPLRPNTALDEAEVAQAAIAPDNLCHDGRRILYTSGHQLLSLPSAAQSEPALVATYDAPIAALAASPAGDLAVALGDGRILLGDRELPVPEGLASPTALAFADGALFVCQGSDRHGPSDWVVDLMEKNAGGSLWRIDLAGGAARCLARGLAFPHGLLIGSDGIVVAESWRHRLVRVPLSGGTPLPVLAKLPGYPARLAPAVDGGAWLSLFAPRNRLIEFILDETDYRLQMMREVPRECWIAPALASERSFLEPLQCGGVKTMGIHKPWSPSRSYGLVVRLDAHLRPVTSFHSRANGHRHGVTSVLEADGRVLAAARGGGVILDIGAAAPGRAAA